MPRTSPPDGVAELHRPDSSDSAAPRASIAPVPPAQPPRPGRARGSGGRAGSTGGSGSRRRTAITAGSGTRTRITSSYRGGRGIDELVESSGRPRPIAEPLWAEICALGPVGLLDRQASAEREMLERGATFAVYCEGGSIERTWPLDVIPRIVPADEWQVVESGLRQRLVALNRFIDDAYHAQLAVRDGVVPASLVTGSPNFRPECMGLDPPGGVWAHICGSDLVRDEHGTFRVLEDNLRVPSGASYMLQNRAVVKEVLPDLFRSYSVAPIDTYVQALSDALRAVSPTEGPPNMAVLTPGIANSAHFEHAFLARSLGAELVEARDLVVLDDDIVRMRTIAGLVRVDVVYRRVDDLYLDAEVFRRDSVVGVPGLLRAMRAGTVAVVNAPGAGVADDKALYAFVPDLIRYYLGEEPILPNVDTFWCGRPDQRADVLANLGSLVVKPAVESGGYGVVIGPRASGQALAQLAMRIEQNPAAWVAQPVVSLSTAPALGPDGTLQARHVDLRPFAIMAPGRVHVTSGGLTRIAKTPGSLIVNSSQGGGSKDTWIVDRVLGAATGSTTLRPEGTAPAMAATSDRSGTLTAPPRNRPTSAAREHTQ